jgi:ATPase family associated with various cellular activities (AAA)/Winged helix domain, variant
MSAADLAAWQHANETYIAAAMEWLRLLLAHHAPAAAVPLPAAGEERAVPRPAPAPQADARASQPWWTFRRAATPAAETPPPKSPLALPPVTTEVTEAQVAEAAERLRAAEKSTPPPAMTILAERFELSPFERDVLLLAVAMEIDTRIAALCARALDDPTRPFPTFALAFAIFEQPSWDALSPERPLLYWRMIEVSQSVVQPMTMSAIRADQRIANYVKGLSHIDERVAPFVMPLADPVHDDDLPESHRVVVDEIVQALQRDRPKFRPLQLLGRDPESKQVVARAAAHRLGVALYRMSADMLPQQAAELETLSRLWHRETFLLPVALYLDAHDVDRSSEAHATPLKRFLARSLGVLFVEARESWSPPRGSHSFEVLKPDPSEQRQMWLAALGKERAAEAAQMAGQFNLSAPAIERIVAEARDDEGNARLDRMWQRAMTHTRLNMDALAQRIEAKARWKNIVLPEPEMELLEQIAAQVAERATVYDDWGFRAKMNRGFGISALFAGASGTGKTMAAEVLANELGLGLHRIDLSSVVSKWVGETEKNLERLFTAAEEGNEILFFDEADALFGKRTEVQHSQDRFANIEINFLLQRLESYRGLAILATNMKNALDQAFLRRLRFIVNFPVPDQNQRRKIWEGVFPEQAPAKNLDLDRLAKLNVTGGSIHNIALTSAFIAARRGTDVTMPIVLQAAKMEMRKLEKPINENEFKWRETELKSV